AYKEVFGSEPPDSVGKPVVVWQNAKSLAIPVRYYCLLYMTLWANTHPRQVFFSRFLCGELALNHVRMAVELCRDQFATVHGDRLAMVLKPEFVNGQPVWRH